MVDADVAAFQHRPERLNAVRMDLTSDKFTRAVLHGFMRLWQVLVATHLIRIHGRIGSDVLFKTALQLVPFGVVNGFSSDFTGRPIEDADNGVLTGYAPLAVSLRGMLILCLSTDIGLIDLDGSKHETVLTISEGCTDAIAQVPRGFLTDPEVPCQLGTGDTFQTR